MVDPGFPGGGTNHRGEHQPIIWQMFAKNCMKMKEIGLRGGAHPSARWIRQWIIAVSGCKSCFGLLLFREKALRNFGYNISFIV